MEKLKNAYNGTALLCFNTVVLFVALNLLSALVLQLLKSPQPSDPVTAKYGELLRQVYPDQSEAETRALLAETWKRPLVFEPFTQFKERPFKGAFVNVHEAGFRLTATPTPWPPDASAQNIFVFGGSTTFGYGVKDNETIPSHLQDILARSSQRRIAVYNFARGFYYSTQERLLFERLLSEGVKPDVAIFVDGINEFFMAGRDLPPLFRQRLEAAFEGSRSDGARAAEIAARMPIMRLLGDLSCRFGKCPVKDRPAEEVAGGNAGALVETTIERYLANKRLIEATADSHAIKTIFVWQPSPTYKYDVTKHPFAGKDFGPHKIAGVGYPALSARAAKSDLGRRFLWCADIQEQLRVPLYVDQIHYSAAFSKTVAECIARLAKERGLL